VGFDLRSHKANRTSLQT